MTGPSLDRYEVVLRTTGGPPLDGDLLKPFLEQGLRTLPARYPGLKASLGKIGPSEVEIDLDLHRLDEDLQRIVQSFKSEVGTLARKQDPTLVQFWRWGFEEK